MMFVMPCDVAVVFGMHCDVAWHGLTPRLRTREAHKQNKKQNETNGCRHFECYYSALRCPHCCQGCYHASTELVAYCVLRVSLVVRTVCYVWVMLCGVCVCEWWQVVFVLYVVGAVCAASVSVYARWFSYDAFVRCVLL